MTTPPNTIPHRRALEALVRFDRPLDEIVRLMMPYTVDAELDPPVLLRKHDMLSVLDRFLAGKLTAREVERWAYLFSGRSDVQCEPTEDLILDQVLMELATPALYGPIDENSVTVKAYLVS